MPYKVSPLRTVWRDEAAGFGLAATGLGFGFGAAALVTAGFGLATAVDGDVRGGCGRVFSTVVVEETGRDGVAVGPGNGRGADDLPVAGFERLVRVIFLPWHARGALAAGVGELEGELRIGVGVHVADDALPGGDVLGFVHAGAGGRDAAVGGDVGHLGEDEAGAA